MTKEEHSIPEIISEVQEYFDSQRFKGIKRLYSARQVAEQQGTIYNDYSIAKNAARDFYDHLRELFGEKKAITTFGPYSPSQAVMMKRAGITGIYLGGWATSAKGSLDEDPGADLASYPLSQVPNEAASIVRALVTADKNQQYNRFKMSPEEREKTTRVDFRPFIIADADTGHGGDAQVRNLIRRFVEAGVPGYHIEDQKPGTKKCGHQGGKVLVPCDEQIKRLNSARFQLDIMRVQGIIVARTDAEAATLIESTSDERDQPFILGATNLEVPSYKEIILTLHAMMRKKGVDSIFGHELYHEQVITPEAEVWLEENGVSQMIQEKIEDMENDEAHTFEKAFDALLAKVVEMWEASANVKTVGEAAVTALKVNLEDGVEMNLQESWEHEFKNMPIAAVRARLKELGVEFVWDCERMRTPEGYYQIKGGIPFAIAKSLAVAPFADILWMETKTADYEDAKQFADAIHAVYPDKMLAYNLSPSFNWDTTGMTEEEMKKFPEDIGKLGFVFNFITYGGHQIDGLAADEFSNALLTEGMLALAKIQRKFRLLDSPYKTPQSHVGGNRLDGALAASSGRTATTKAMGKGSTQVQHLVHTELSTKVLAGWIQEWAKTHRLEGDFSVQLRPQSPGSLVLELTVLNNGEQVANVVFGSLVDRNQQSILSVRDQNTEENYRRKRLMTLVHIFLLNRFKSNVVHYLTPTEDNAKQCEGMLKRGIYFDANHEVGQIIVATVNVRQVKKYVDDEGAVKGLIQE